MSQPAGKTDGEGGQKVLVTVVIPAFRARRYLPEALASVRAQSYSSWEVVVVDDCSPEPVDDLVSAFAATVSGNRVRLIRHSENKGLGATRNTGILAANGEYIAFLDHDDIWRETHLEDAIAAMESEAAGLVYCDCEMFREKAGDLPKVPVVKAQTEGAFPASLYMHNSTAPSGVVMRKRVLEELKLFATDPEIHMCEDMDLWLRAAGHGVKVARVPKANLLYRKHPESATSNPRLISEAKAHAIHRNLHTLSQVPFSLRLKRTRIVCAEAARYNGLENPAKAAYFYGLSVRTNPRLERVWIKHLLAFLFYRTMSLFRPMPSGSQFANKQNGSSIPGQRV